MASDAGAQQHHRPHDLGLDRPPHARRVGADQRLLELLARVPAGSGPGPATRSPSTPHTRARRLPPVRPPRRRSAPLPPSPPRRAKPARPPGLPRRRPRPRCRKPRSTSYRSAAPGPGRTATAPSGGVAPGGNRASTWPPNPPPMIRAPSAPASLQPPNRLLDRRRRDLIAVTQRGVRGIEQPAERPHVPPRERVDRLVDPGVLAHHVLRPQRQRRRRSGAIIAKVASRRLDSPSSDGRLGALRPALVVPRSRVGVLLAGVERHEPERAELERHRIHGQRPEVDPQRPVALAEQ